MTVPAKDDYVNSSPANGVTTIFPYGFKITASEDLVVEVDGTKQTTGYSVTGVGNSLGGNVQFASPPAYGSIVTRYLDPVLKRDTNFTQFGDWMAQLVNLDFDRIWLAIQSLSQFRKRAIKLPVDTTTDQVITATATERAGNLIGFDAFGNAVLKVPADLDLTLVSPFIATLLNDLDAEEARATLEALGVAGGNLSGAINEARATVAGNATTTPIWAAAGNAVAITGTPTITDFPDAPQAGAVRRIFPTAGTTITNNANIAVQGGTSYTFEAGDWALIEAVTTATFLTTIFKANGQSVSNSSKQLLPISVVASGNTLVISATEPLSLDFRSGTLGSGAVTRVTGTPANLVISNGSTLGSVSAVKTGLNIRVMNNAGTLEFAVDNVAGGIDDTEMGLISTTAEGGAGAADSATVIYSATARTNLSYRIVGYVEYTQATAGTYATQPSLVQPAGGRALAAMRAGTVHDMTGSRSFDTNYFNPFPFDIDVYIRTNNVSTHVVAMHLNGSIVQDVGAGSLNYYWYHIRVRPGMSYKAQLISGSATFAYWKEVY